MNGAGRRTQVGPGSSGKELLRCPACDAYIARDEGFTCPRCKRGPLCRHHRYPGTRECNSCATEKQAVQLTRLVRQEKSLRSFLHLLQFVFIAFAILFVAKRFGLAGMVDFLQNTIITEALPFVLVGAAVCYCVFYVILYDQKKRIRELEARTGKGEFRRLV